MPYYLKSKPRVVALTYKLACWISSLPKTKGERPLAPRRLAEHRRNVEAGKFRAPEWCIAYCEADGKWYLVNGQHTSYLLAEMLSNGGHVPVDNVILSMYVCTDDQALSDLWQTFDSPITSRHTRDRLRSALKCHTEFDDFSLDHCRACVNALTFVQSFDNRHQVNIQDKVLCLLQEIEFLRFFSEAQGWASDYKQRARFNASGVCAAMYATWKTSPEAARTFWKEVNDGSNPDGGHPTRMLREKLIEICAKRASSKSDEDARRKFCICVQVWNAWVNGSEPHMKFYKERSNPQVFPMERPMDKF